MNKTNKEIIEDKKSAYYWQKKLKIDYIAAVKVIEEIEQALSVQKQEFIKDLLKLYEGINQLISKYEERNN